MYLLLHLYSVLLGITVCDILFDEIYTLFTDDIHTMHVY